MNIAISILIILMISAAVIALEVRDLLAAVVSVGAVGIILSFSFLLLQAPDLAIVQLVVEILALVVLIRSTIVRDETTYNAKEFFNRSATIIGIFFLLVFLIFAIKELPRFGFPKMNVSSYYIGEGIKNGISQTGAANIVASIILDYRAYDTLGEATVLFCAVLGVLTIMRKIGRKEKSRNETR